MRLRMAFLGLLLAHCDFVIAKAYAEPSRIQINKAQQQTRRPAVINDEFKTERLTEQVDFPDVPRYTGKVTFLSGLRYPHDRNGQRVGMTLGVNEPADEVIQWYKDTLKSYRWNVLRDSPESRVVSATKDGNTFSVRIAPTYSPGYKTLIVLSFQYGR